VGGGGCGHAVGGVRGSVYALKSSADVGRALHAEVPLGAARYKATMGRQKRQRGRTNGSVQARDLMLHVWKIGRICRSARVSGESRRGAGRCGADPT